MLYFVGVFRCMRIHALHTLALWGASDTSLGGMDVVVKTVEESYHNLGRKALAEQDLEVVKFVKRPSTHWIVVKTAHSPSEGTGVLHELRVQLGIALSDKLLVTRLLVHLRVCIDLSNVLLVFSSGCEICG